MWARLRTACGAVREVKIQFPPQAQIVVPLRRTFKSWVAAEEPGVQPILTRTFELDHQSRSDMERTHLGPEDWVLDYYERLP